MKTIINFIIKIFGSDFKIVVLRFLETTNKVVDFLNRKTSIKQKEIEDLKRKEHESKIEDVCINGNLNDLLDLTKDSK